MNLLNGIRIYAPLFWLRVRVYGWRLTTFVHDFLHFLILSKKFLKADVRLRLFYLFHNPYRLAHSFWNEAFYGETPYAVLEAIQSKLHLSEEDLFVDFGAGRGLGLLFMHYRTGCRVLGVEKVPEFVEYFERLCDEIDGEKMEMVQNDFFIYTPPFYKKPPVIYLFGTCLKREEIIALNAHLSPLPVGTRVISVSYPLKAYPGGDAFEVQHRFSGVFAHGESDIFIQTKCIR